MATVRRLFRIFKTSMVNNIAIEMNFRINFFLIIVVEIVWLTVLMGQFHFLLQDGATLGPWQGVEYYFFVCVVTFMDNIFLSLIAPNFWNFADLLRLGNLDFLLTKPTHSLFLTMTQIQRLSGLIASLFSVGIGIWLLPQLGITWSPTLVAGFLLIVLLCMLLRLAIEVAISVMNFITIEGQAINIFRINLQQFSKYPAFIYRGPTHIILTRIFPLCLITTLPVEWLLGSAGPLWAAVGIVLGLNVLLWIFALLGWKWGINRYESASS